MREDGRMHDRRDDYEPIIATRPSRVPPRQEAQPLWHVVLALVGGLAVVVLLAWWWMSRPSTDSDATNAQSQGEAPEALPESHVEQEVLPPARDPEPSTPQVPASPAPVAEPERDAEPSATQESTPTQESAPDVVPDAPDQEDLEPIVPPPPTPVSVRLSSPDPQVRIELYRPLDVAPALTSKVGEVVDVQPGTYRVVASGADLRTVEQEVTFDGERPMEYTVELCAEPKRERESLTGQVVESRACSSTEECESMFMILGEYAGELVKERAFRTQQCAKWRPNAAPDGSWTLNINCDGATPATTCRIVIAEGACTLAEPPRSARGTACPRAELN